MIPSRPGPDALFPRGDLSDYHKHCPECGIMKHHSEYWAHQRRPDGLQARCKVCATVAQAQSRERARRRREATQQGDNDGD